MKEKIRKILIKHEYHWSYQDTILDELLSLFDVMKCPFCGSKNIEPSMFIEEFDCKNCLKSFKEKDFS